MSCLFNCKTQAYSQMVQLFGSLAKGSPYCGDTLSFGTQKGWLAVWQWESSTDQFAEIHAKVVSDSAGIMCLAADTNDHKTSSYCLALGTQSIVCQIWIIKKTHVKNIVSIRLDNTIPRSVIFCSNSEHNLYVFGTINRHMLTVTGKDGHISEYYILFTHIFIQTLEHAEEDKVLVVGSDIGIVYVFDVETRKKVKVLYHSENAFVQSITTHTTSESSYIICGLTDKDKELFVSLWIKSNPSKPIIEDL
ncbi:uncharacterized protein FOMMEDRAFT_25085 [Fomitiporia mediterranea MF3/22]|uniref:uncharacterized protein n=1 Tax=Fomitiporia mediterranea (strain MF3/22) TaxID=694068 RepID=UPI00044087FE|nr:uncharacterized protein FOMMEDRAFT_25085 [Fomitiporia mediterranea MF3/22]EJD07813.1 hypothetical protein FOMMEDRAFT_25085 [Fomitiporia mediterranea MF3/22]